MTHNGSDAVPEMSRGPSHRRMKYLTPVFPFLAGWILLLLSHTLSTIALVNGVAQLLLFFFVVHLHFWQFFLGLHCQIVMEAAC